MKRPAKRRSRARVAAAGGVVGTVLLTAQFWIDNVYIAFLALDSVEVLGLASIPTGTFAVIGLLTLGALLILGATWIAERATRWRG